VIPWHLVALDWTMAHTYDAILLIAFGGPTRMEEVRPFLANVLRDRSAAPERVEEVVRHYELIGGRSPLNELTFRQADALRALLRSEGPDLPVFVGMRNWNPFLRDALAEMKAAGARRALGFILSAQQSPASWDRYQLDVAQGQREVGPGAPQVDYAGEWHAHPLFIEAVAARVLDALDSLSSAERKSVRTVFTAHSLPVAMAAASPYVDQLSAAVRLVAERVHLTNCRLAYQSRSGSRHEPWLGPDVLEVIRALAAENTRRVLIVPIGFVCDHVEVLYDLDIEARAVAESLGIEFHRAQTVNDHPLFIRMMAEVIRRHVAAN
jgi:ferrochelatase